METSEQPTDRRSRLERIHALWQRMIDCECGALCFDCTDALGEIGDASEK
jgi:hypothetical protein